MKLCSHIGCAMLISAGLSGCDRSSPQPVSPLHSAVAGETPAAAAKEATSELTATEVTAHAPAMEGEALRTQNGRLDPSQPDALQPDALQPDGRQVAKQIELEQRPFATLQPLTTTDPQALIDHLRQIDAALQDLVLAGSSNFLDEKTFTDGGLRLGRMKQSAGAQLVESPESSPEQRKAGILAQLVALSHMSGLRDVAAAQDLERFATQLSGSGDEDLAHQARVVLLGFELQSLQNGLQQKPDALMAQVDQLLTRPQDRGFPEFMVLQQAHQVLTQMGFDQAAERVRQTLVEGYRAASDPQLRGEAWLIEVQGSQAYQNFLQAFRDLGAENFDPAAGLAALRGLYEAFPTMQTLEQIATTIANIEYSGHVALSQDVARFTTQALAGLDQSDATYVRKALADHAARLSLMNQPLQLEGLVGFDGRPLDWNEYAGQVVLVDFWASWCLKCMREIPAIRQVHSEFADRGFAVLSINMDENLASGREFVQQQKFPWRSYHSADLQALGFQSPLARQLGINAIPLMILLDRDGRVAAMHVRGPQLRPAVEKLINPPTE